MPTIQPCTQQPHHPHNCMYQVIQYPWHDFNGFILENRDNNNSTISTLLIWETYDLCIKNLSKNKIPGLDQIPNSILKNMPTRFHNMLFLLFSHCYKQKTIPSYWKKSNTILLYKKDNPSQLNN